MKRMGKKFPEFAAHKDAQEPDPGVGKPFLKFLQDFVRIGKMPG